jgi:hypothetical protein
VLGQTGHAQNTPLINEFKELSTSDVAALIKSSSLKTCSQIINTSLQLGSFPAEWKEALVLPLLKKRRLAVNF